MNGISDQNIAIWSQTGAKAYFDAISPSIAHARYNAPWNVATDAAGAGKFSSWLSVVRSMGKVPMVSFDLVHGVAPPTAAEYRTAVSAFLTRWPEVRTFTAWNEPNHSRRGSGSVEPNPISNPQLAADYYVELRSMCSGCAIAAGDFSEEGNTADYATRYKARLTEHGVVPSAWAIHPYRSLNTADGTALQSFMRMTGNADIWFTEAGGFVCEPPRSGSGSGGTYYGEAAQLTAAQKLIALAQDARIKRVYWYQFSTTQTQAACASTSGLWDTALVGSGNTPRAALYYLFPQSLPPFESRYLATIAGNGAGWLKYGLPGGTWLPMADPGFALRDIEVDYNRLVVVAGDGAVWLKDSLPGGAWLLLFGPEFNAREVEIAGDRLAVVAGDGSIWLKQGLPGGSLDRIAGSEFNPRNISLNGNRLSVAAGDGSVWLKDGLPGGAWHLMFVSSFNARAVSLSGDRLAAVRGDGAVLLKEGLPNGPTWVMGGPEFASRDIVLDGSWLASANGNGTVWLKQVPGGTWNLMFGGEFNAIDIDMSGNRIAVLNGNNRSTWIKEGLPGGPIYLMGGVEFAVRKLSLR